MPEVDSVDYVTRDEALDDFRDSMKAQGREDLTRYLDSNPLYASLEVKLIDAGRRGGRERRLLRDDRSSATSSTSRTSSTAS